MKVNLSTNYTLSDGNYYSKGEQDLKLELANEVRRLQGEPELKAPKKTQSKSSQRKTQTKQQPSQQSSKESDQPEQSEE
jgi:hypothetical protein